MNEPQNLSPSKRWENAMRELRKLGEDLNIVDQKQAVVIKGRRYNLHQLLVDPALQGSPGSSTLTFANIVRRTELVFNNILDSMEKNIVTQARADGSLERGTRELTEAQLQTWAGIRSESPQRIPKAVRKAAIAPIPELAILAAAKSGTDKSADMNLSH